MLVNYSDIHKTGDFPANFDYKQLDNFIFEVETEIIRPAIGNKLFIDIEKNREQHKDILFPFYYEDGCKYHPGLIVAESYLIYSKYIPYSNFRLNANGIHSLYGDSTQLIEEDSLYKKADDKRKSGLEYLRQVLDYLKCRCDECCSGKEKIKYTHFFNTFGRKRM